MITANKNTRRSFISGAAMVGLATMLPLHTLKAEAQSPTITIPQAREFYRAYSVSGHLPKDAHAFLKSRGYPGKDSREIKSADYGDCMAWAKTAKR